MGICRIWVYRFVGSRDSDLAKFAEFGFIGLVNSVQICSFAPTDKPSYSNWVYRSTRRGDHAPRVHNCGAEAIRVLQALGQLPGLDFA